MVLSEPVPQMPRLLESVHRNRLRAHACTRRKQDIAHVRKRALERALVVGHERVGRAARGAPELGLVEIKGYGPNELGYVVHLPCGTTLERHRADFLEMEHVRAENHGNAHGARLEQVLPTPRHEATADERDVGGGVEQL
jgi:hypothetical protein